LEKRRKISIRNALDRKEEAKKGKPVIRENPALWRSPPKSRTSAKGEIWGAMPPSLSCWAA